LGKRKDHFDEPGGRNRSLVKIVVVVHILFVVIIVIFVFIIVVIVIIEIILKVIIFKIVFHIVEVVLFFNIVILVIVVTENKEGKAPGVRKFPVSTRNEFNRHKGRRLPGLRIQGTLPIVQNHSFLPKEHVLLKHKGEIQYLSSVFFSTFSLLPQPWNLTFHPPSYTLIPVAIVTIEAPAKINLHLRIGARRPDGYHDLESLFLALNFGDSLRFEALDAGRDAIVMDWDSRGGFAVPDLPQKENIIGRALDLFRARTGAGGMFRVFCKKRIPPGGGLGGGSSDAAAALRALNILAGTGLSPEELGAMAGELGSDVPFFLAGGAAWVSGRGERVRPLPVPPGLSVVLVNPGFPGPTAEAFRRLDRAREKAAPGGAGPVRRGAALPAEGPGGPREGDVGAILRDNPRNWPFWNDFTPVLIREGGGEGGAGAEGAEYSRILARLDGAGADFSGISGAGSTCFGVFSRPETAKRAAALLSKRWIFTELTFLLAFEANGVLE
jgi:4-diphosphocytidyl-2-C-methyl-D-erythritol kinase